MRTSLLLASVLALPSFASAQLLIAPENMFVFNTGTSGFTWRSTQFHFQMIYDTTHFTNQGVVGQVSIDRLRFRGGSALTHAGTTYLGDGATFGVNISIGTSATDYLTPSTTFATNRGVMQSVMTNGTVVVSPSAGTTPNSYNIDIIIPGGFLYDPTLGQDLVVEVDAPAPAAGMPIMATGSSQATHRSVRISQSTQAALTGGTSGFASVILFDISGGPGGIPAVVLPVNQPYGIGCYFSSRSFAEEFPASVPALDLGAGITLTPNVLGAPTRYSVSAGAGAFVPPVGIPVLSNTGGAMGDDTMSAAMTLTSFSFPHVGGSTSVLHANSNGYLTLVAVTGSAGDFSPTLGELVNISVGTHSSLPRLCPAWYDFHASRNVSLNPNAGVYFEEDAVNQTATVTWLDVGEFATAAAGGASHSFQVHINANGTVEYRYGPMTPFPSNSSPKIIGFTPGAPGVVPVSQDLSATMTFLSSLADSVPLSLAVTGTLIAGGSITATTDGVPGPLPGTVITFLGDTQIPLGFDLGGIGMPDCSAYLDVTTAIGMLLSGTPTAALSIPIPNNPALGGRSFYLQSGAFDASMQNAFGALTSNGVRLVIGNVQ